MWFAGNETILLLIIYALHVHCRTVLKTQKINKTDIVPSLKEYETFECRCGEHEDCSFEGENKVCKCMEGYKDKKGICEECSCGEHGDCSFEGENKVCKCMEGYKDKKGICEECNCGDNGKCRFNGYEKICLCNAGFIEKDGSCQECNCGDNGKCRFNGYEKICLCNAGFIEKDGSCQECDCGQLGKCTFEYGRKKCICDSFTSEKNGKCVECDCDKNSKSCHFDRKGDKVCNCTSGYAQVFGICEAICTEDKCKHGKCEIVGNGFKCRCSEGFTGQHCEEKVQAKLSKQDLWMVLQLSVVFAIFILLSGMFCFWTRILKKISKK
ncbi:unnamed protein product [Larinioides sclopetarius]|uniref:EGF-like domain-containing protein n=1 Tax=Larinioides sclopetarius TaxID=280406 RepID=A0AAV2BXQ2_9ARAC